MFRALATCAVLTLAAVPGAVCADTLHVPAEWPTIQSAVDAASVGDTVQIAPGVYAECVQLGCGVTLLGDAQSPGLVAIDGEHTHRCVRCEEAGPPATIVGLTLQNGKGDIGGGVWIDESSAVVTDCIFKDNLSVGHGGGLLARYSSAEIARCVFDGNETLESGICGGGGASIHGAPATIEDCEFRGNSARKGGGLAIKVYADVSVTGCTFESNSALFWGGGLLCWESTARLSGCTFVGNSGGTGGGGIGVTEYSDMTVSNSIIAFGEDGPSVSVGAATTLSMDCCDLFGNAGGDWVDYIADQLGSNGNIEADPLFCGDAATATPYALHDASPCAPDASQCGLIGAWPVECLYSPVQETSWGVIKSMYR